MSDKTDIDLVTIAALKNYHNRIENFEKRLFFVCQSVGIYDKQVVENCFNKIIELKKENNGKIKTLNLTNTCERVVIKVKIPRK